VRIDAVSLHDAVDRLLTGSGPTAVHLCNAYTVSLAVKDLAFRDVVNAGHLNLPDGMPLVWIARRLGISCLDRRTYGPDLMAEALSRGQNVGTRHFLYGSTPAVLNALVAEIAKRWPAAKVVGSIAAPFRPITNDDLLAAIEAFEAADANVVWVGMGTPKQDDLVARMAASGTHTYVAIGAAFDFIAGTKKQAPTWMRNSGLEWLFRMASEPRRLWKRYLVGNTRFVWANLRQRPALTRPDAPLVQTCCRRRQP